MKVRIGYGFGVRTNLNDDGFTTVVDALERLHFDSLWLNFAGTDFVAGGYTLSDVRLGIFDLTNANFSGLDLSGMYTPNAGVDFTGANLTGAIITGAFLWNAKGFTTAQILSTNRDWTDTWLPQSPLTVPLDFEGFDFVAGGVTLTGTRTYRYDLDGANFAAMDLRGTVLLRAWLRNANLTGVDLTGASLADSLMNGADLSGSDLSGADLSNVTGLPHGGASATWTGATCPDRVVVDGTTVTTCVGHGVAA